MRTSLEIMGASFSRRTVSRACRPDGNRSNLRSCGRCRAQPGLRDSFTIRIGNARCPCPQEGDRDHERCCRAAIGRAGDRGLARRLHRDADDRAAEEGPAQRMDAQRATAADEPRRRVGRAFTLRFVPAREDLATPASWGAPISTRAAIEAMPAGVRRRRRRDGRGPRRHLRRHPLRAHAPARGRGAGDRRRRARRRGRPRDGACRCGARASPHRHRWPGSPSSTGRNR